MVIETDDNLLKLRLAYAVAPSRIPHFIKIKERRVLPGHMLLRAINRAGGERAAILRESPVVSKRLGGYLRIYSRVGTGDPTILDT